MELRNAPLLKASRRSSKEGGARSREEYKGAGRQVCVGGFFWWSSWSGSSARGGLSVEKRSVERPVCRSSQSVGSPGVARGTRTGGAALPALSRKPTRPSGERRRELAGPVEGPSQPRLSGLPWQHVTTRPSRHLDGAGNLQRSRGALSVTKAPRHKGLRTPSDSLVCEGVFAFFSFE